MSTIYYCVACDQPYCVECDGGQDSCEVCNRGPFCDDCAVEHGAECKTNEVPSDAATATGMYDHDDVN